MSGFSAEWLELRERADQLARNRILLAVLSARLAGRSGVQVVDLGCGSGANLRALAALLPQRQHWRLLDNDPLLLEQARSLLTAWADRAEPAGCELSLKRGGRTIQVAFAARDLARDLDAALGEADLVTAAALFDLVSAPWIEGFVEALARRRALLHASLTYDGLIAWDPPHPGDAEMSVAFNSHQRGDKGFGPSAGPEAGQILARALLARGYRVRTGQSPWRLGAESGALIRELALGIAQAVRETGRVPEPAIGDWLEGRLSGASCVVGHTDLIAWPLG